MTNQHKRLQWAVGVLLIVLLLAAVWLVPKSVYYYSATKGVDNLQRGEWNQAITDFERANRISSTEEIHTLYIYANKQKLQDDVRNVTLRYEQQLTSKRALEREAKRVIYRYESMEEINFLTEKSCAILSEITYKKGELCINE